jgi:hypothetical protein
MFMLATWPTFYLERIREYHVARRNKTIEDFDFDITKEASIDCLNDTFDSMYRDVLPSVDELLVRPTEGLLFCAAIRQRLRCVDIPEDVILRAMHSHRKHG